MRVVLVLLLLVSAPAAALVLEDPAGDVAVTLDGEPAGALTDRFANVDLRGLELEEGPDAITFRLHLDGLDQDGVALLDTIEHAVAFHVGSLRYDLVLTRGYYVDSAPGEASHRAELFRTTTDGEAPRAVAEYDVEVDESAGTLAAVVPRIHLVDQQGAKAAPGTVLADLHATSRSVGGDLANIPGGFVGIVLGEGSVPRVAVEDRMPDAGAASYTVQTGGGVSHGLTLTVEEPTRASNGEATTLLFVLRLRNDQADARALHFQQDGAPADWDVWFPAEGATVEAGAVLEVPVLVRMPFVHRHGARNEWTVRVSDAADGEVYAETGLAVAFTEVPQPSGHHPRLWIHTAPSPNDIPVHSDDVRGGRSLPFLNAQEEDGDGSPAGSNAFLGPNRTGGWRIPLTPGLGMGLHFVDGGEGALSVTLAAGNEPQQGLRLGGALVHVDRTGNETTLGRFETGPVDMTPGSGRVLAVSFPLDSGVGRIPYEPRANLELHVWPDSDVPMSLQHAFVFGSDLSLLGGTLDLPLLEYHDDVDAAFGDLQTLRLDAPLREAFVNPGKTTVFTVDVTNAGATDRDLRLGLTGGNAGWATVTPQRLSLPAGGTVPVVVAVRVPEGAAHGEQADLVLEAEGDGARALLRLVARVDTEAEHEDQSALVPAARARDSPGVASPLAAAVLAATALAARRRGT